MNLQRKRHEVGLCCTVVVLAVGALVAFNSDDAALYRFLGRVQRHDLLRSLQSGSRMEGGFVDETDAIAERKEYSVGRRTLGFFYHCRLPGRSARHLLRTPHLVICGKVAFVPLFSPTRQQNSQ